MKTYRRLSRESGVIAYQLDDESIRVKFVDGSVYTYSYASAGQVHVEQMKVLATCGRGLSTYISKYVKEKFESVA